MSADKKKGPSQMSLNFAVNLLMLPLFLATVITGIVKFPGLLEFLGISARRMPIPMQLLTDIHDWAGLGLTVLILVHVLQHLKMSINFFKGKLKGRKNKAKAAQPAPAPHHSPKAE